MAADASLMIEYDSHGDILHVFDGQPYATTNVEVDQNFTLRLDPRTQDLIGLIVHRYSVVFPGVLAPQVRKAVGQATFRLFAQLHREQKLKEPSVA